MTKRRHDEFEIDNNQQERQVRAKHPGDANQTQENNTAKRNRDQIESDKEEQTRRVRARHPKKEEASHLTNSSDAGLRIDEREGIWTSLAASERNQLAEALHYQAEDEARREVLREDGAGIQKPYEQRWQELNQQQQQELDQLEQNQQAEIETIKQDQTKERKQMSAQHKEQRVAEKAVYKAKVQAKKQELKHDKKQAWTTHLNKDEVKEIRSAQLARLKQVSAEHADAREKLKQEFTDNSQALKVNQAAEKEQLLSRQQNELAKLRPAPGQSSTKEQEAKLKEQHAEQLAALEARHAEEISTVRGDYIYARNELTDEQDADIANMKLENRQSLREAVQSKLFLKAIITAHHDQIEGLKSTYQATLREKLSTQTSERVEMLISQEETLSATITRHFRQMTNLYKTHEEQRDVLREEELQAMGYNPKSPAVDGPKIEPSDGGSEEEENEEEQQNNRGFGMGR